LLAQVLGGAGTRRRNELLFQNALDFILRRFL
jgi:hypothetical protein